MGNLGSSRRREEEEEGSRREGGPLALTWEYCAPLLTDTCPLLEQPAGVVERVLGHLTVRELAAVAATCTALRAAVEELLRHEAASLNLGLAMAAFRTMVGSLVTEAEGRAMGRVEGAGVAGGRYRAVAEGRALLRHYSQQVNRISCAAEEVVVPHRNNPSYYTLRREEVLGREVVELREVCWLAVEHTWEGVGEGRWEVALRLSLLPTFSWPHREGQMSSWRVAWPGGEEEERVGRQWWRMVQQRLDREVLAPREQVIGGANLRVEVEVVEGRPTRWVRVVLPSFTTSTVGRVTLSFKDTECPWWKGGIAFDFLELRRLD